MMDHSGLQSDCTVGLGLTHEKDKCGLIEEALGHNFTKRTFGK